MKITYSTNGYYYDNKNILTKLQKINTKTRKEDTITYEYDNQGNTIKEKSQEGEKRYFYDIYNRTIEVRNPKGNVLKNKYDPLGL
ncbi:hypothetical protein, partial [Defluviitalea phaphyphila]|uniref:hypothetical protein n=1 Tax=Defluviitalea phaphyphila TaxID=1473580 RepID=UPI0013655835